MHLKVILVHLHFFSLNFCPIVLGTMVEFLTREEKGFPQERLRDELIFKAATYTVLCFNQALILNNAKLF